MVGVTLLFALSVVAPGTAESARYADVLCRSGDFSCVRVERGETWQSKWPNAQDRDVIKRINRMNVRLRTGMRIAVPNNRSYLDRRDYSPHANYFKTQGRRTLVMNPRTLSWGAYNSNGRLLRWGPASFGKAYCSDVKRRCRTVLGRYTVYTKRGAGCFSSKYPIGRGGAPMPHCMFFYRGYAIHGSPNVPGYHASHGCIRVFKEDARWLNTQFVGGARQTRVIVLPY